MKMEMPMMLEHEHDDCGSARMITALTVIARWPMYRTKMVVTTVIRIMVSRPSFDIGRCQRPTPELLNYKCKS